MNIKTLTERVKTMNTKIDNSLLSVLKNCAPGSIIRPDLETWFIKGTGYS